MDDEMYKSIKRWLRDYELNCSLAYSRGFERGKREGVEEERKRILTLCREMDDFKDIRAAIIKAISSPAKKDYEQAMPVTATAVGRKTHGKLTGLTAEKCPKCGGSQTIGDTICSNCGGTGEV